MSWNEGVCTVLSLIFTGPPRIRTKNHVFPLFLWPQKNPIVQLQNRKSPLIWNNKSTNQVVLTPTNSSTDTAHDENNITIHIGLLQTLHNDQAESPVNSAMPAIRFNFKLSLEPRLLSKSYTINYCFGNLSPGPERYIPQTSHLPQSHTSLSP